MGQITEAKLHNGDDRPTSPLKAIKAFCMECCGYDRNAIKQCAGVGCPLWSFKDGKNPYRKSKEYTEEELDAIRARFANSRKDKNGETFEANYEED